ncbi:flagellar assembly protein FlaJ [Thermoplasma sp. Kam2015]|nr:flagellar assembly protein FlaJ [Thermoplasma sp. Kam2015]
MDTKMKRGFWIGINYSKTDLMLIAGSAVMSVMFYLVYMATQKTFILILFSMLALGSAFLFLKPIIDRDNKKNDINSNIPFFITAFSSLATSDANIIDLLDILSKKEKLGYLRKELEKILNLVRNWGMGLAEAMTFVAKRTPSDIFSDFLTRFGHAIDSGQDIQEFARTEVFSTMNSFETAYTSALYSFDLYRDIYVSLLLSFAFLITFIMIMPILIPINITVVLSLSLLMVALGEFMLVYGISIVLPKDPLWHKTGIKTDTDIKMRNLFFISITASMMIFIILDVTKIIYKIPFYFTFAMIVSPIAYPSYIGSKMEREVQKKDEMYGSFIRSLSGSASARGNLLIDALKAIVMHDFGILSKDIDKLYKRLLYRINSLKAWKMFSADTGSHLIEIYSETYAESIDLGADALKSGMIVSENFEKIVGLRKRKHSSVTSFVGIMYGITAGLAFSLAISYGILKIIDGIFSGFNLSALGVTGIFLAPPSSSVYLIEIFLMIILFVHSFIGGVSLKVSDGGRIVHGLHHTVLMIWIVSFVVYGTLQITSILLSSTV